MRFFFFFQAEDGIRDLVRSRGLGDVYKRQVQNPFNMGYLAVKTMVDVARGKPVEKRIDTGAQLLSLIHI